ncbi:unnamed protein product, partial [Brenthis ino]
MLFKAGILILMLFIGSYAFPVEDDLSIYFDHTDASARIVGGTTADIVPHMVGLVTSLIGRTLFCGGSLVSTRHVLTAAHCIEPVQYPGGLSSTLRGIVGTNHFSYGGTEIVFARAILHPDFNSRTIKNDIGILVSSFNISLSNSIGLVSLSYDWVDPGVATSTSGWGATKAGGMVSLVLLTLHAQVVDGESCKNDVARRAAELELRNAPLVDPYLEICTFHSNHHGVCGGDSGSALIRKDNGQQIGIVSWSIPCAQNAPDMFVRVSTYKDWLQQNLH